MKNLGHYLNKILTWFKEGWKLLFENTEDIRSHHLIAFLLVILMIYLLSYVVARIFRTLLMILVLIAVFWLLWMLLFDRSKFRELFSKEGSISHGNNGNRNDD